MATFEVDNWADLKARVASAASYDVVKLTADIDLNDGYATGVTSGITGYCTIDGDGHTIRNATYVGSESLLCASSSDSYLTIRNVKLENVDIQTEESDFSNRVKFYDSDITIKLENGTRLDYTGNIAFISCGVTIRGYGDVILDAGKLWQDDDNFTIEGSFFKVELAPRRTFISGEFSVNSGQYLTILYAIKSVFVATFSGKIWGTTTSAYNKGCAIDREAAPGNIIYPNVFLQCTTEQIKSPSYLDSQGFPIIPIVVGGD